MPNPLLMGLCYLLLSLVLSSLKAVVKLPVPEALGLLELPQLSHLLWAVPQAPLEASCSAQLDFRQASVPQPLSLVLMVPVSLLTHGFLELEAPFQLPTRRTLAFQRLPVFQP